MITRCLPMSVMLKSLFSGLFLLLCAVTCSGCFHAAAPVEVGASEEPHPVPVQAVSVKPAVLRPALDLVGTVLAVPERTAVVSPQLGGWVVTLSVVEGQVVQAGDVLVQLDDRAAKADVERAKALVAEKTAALARLKSGYLPQELETARQDRDKLRAAVEGLKTEVSALEELLKRREISQVQYESKAKALESAVAALASADSHLKLLEAGTRSELIDEAQALLEAAKVDVEHAQLTLDWCVIRSPISGVVVQLLAHQGQFFDRAVPLATIMDLTEVFAQLRVPGREFSKVGTGTKVDVELESLPGSNFQGEITRISGQADPLTGNIIVFALLKNPNLALRPGLSCQAHVWLPEIPNALAVPAAAVGDHSGTPVITIIRDGKAYETEVKLGVKARDLVQIVEGISPGDIVATAGGYGLPEGCPVQVVSDPATAHASNE